MITNAVTIVYLRAIIVSLLLSLGWVFLFPAAVNAQENPIVVENQLAGSDAWKLNRPANDQSMQIKGFASRTSVNKGQSIKFHVHVNFPQSYKIDIYRMGWYNGKGGRLVKSIGPLNGTSQPAPTINSTTGMVTAPWASSYTLQIPTSWTSGVYIAKLINANGFDNYMVFVVRNDNNTADFLYQQAVTTSQAYNNFPNDGVLGKSLYRYNSYGGNVVSGGRGAVKVSFNRPYAKDGSGLFFEWQVYLIQWLEKEGYNVTYSTNIDQHNDGAALLNYKGFISGGHDEYWTKEIYDAVENARDAGVNLFFSGANAAYWQSRLENNNRVLVVYKNASVDPEPNAALKTIKFRDLGRAEQGLVGIQYKGFNDSFSATTPYIVRNSNHWVYENTGFSNGSSVPGIVGYEIDNVDPNFPGPPANGTQVILSDSPFVDDANTTLYADSSIYQASSGAWVFATGTMSWSWALTNNGYINSGIKQTTRNVLDRFLGDSISSTPVIIRIDPVTISSGQTVNVPLKIIPGDSGEQIGVVTFKVNYNNSIVALTDCTMNDFFGSCNFEQNSGTVQISGVNSQGLGGDSVAAIMAFRAIGPVGSSSSLDITVDTFANAAGDSIANYQVVNGQISVDASSLLLGDVNCDGAITSVDALFVLQYEVNLRSNGGGCPLANTETELYAEAGDVNVSGSTTAVDALLILQCVVNIPNSFCPNGAVIAANHMQEAAAASSAKITLISDKESLSVQLQPENVAMGAGTFELNYNGAHMQLIECIPAQNGFCHEGEPGKVKISMVNPVGVTETTMLAELIFDSDHVEVGDVQVMTLVDNKAQDIAFQIVREQAEEKIQGQYQLLLPFLQVE